MKAAAIAAIALSAAIGTANAATPSSGTLTIDGEPLEYQGDGPYFNFNQGNYLSLVDPSIQYMCQPPVLECDEFALTIDLPEEIVAVYPSATVRMSFGFNDPTGQGQEDYDFFLLDADGNIVNRGETLANPEVIVVLAEGGVTEYTIVGIPYVAVNSNYNGKIELVLGEPAPSDSFKVSDGGSAGAGAGGGPLGPLMLAACGLLALRRKRAG